MMGAAIGIDESTTLPDTKEGREIRILIAGYSSMLADAAKAHEPLSRLCEIKEEIDHAMDRAISATIRNAAKRN